MPSRPRQTLVLSCSQDWGAFAEGPGSSRCSESQIVLGGPEFEDVTLPVGSIAKRVANIRKKFQGSIVRFSRAEFGDFSDFGDYGEIRTTHDNLNRNAR